MPCNSAWAMPASVTARHNTWLRHWDVDAASQAKGMGIPFKGSKLFSEALNPLLFETKGKKKVLLTKERLPSPRPSTPIPFFVAIDHKFLEPHPLLSSPPPPTEDISQPGSKSTFKPHAQPAPQFPNPTLLDAQGSPQIGGRQFFADKWNEITSDWWIQNTVR